MKLQRVRCLFGRHADSRLRIDQGWSIGIGVTQDQRGIGARYWIDTAHYECPRCGKHLGEWSPDDTRVPLMTIEPHSLGFQVER